VLFRNLHLISICRVSRLRSQPLAQRVRQFGLQVAGINARLDSTENVEPVRVWLLQNARLPLQVGFIVKWNPERGRIAGDSITEKARRRDPNNRNCLVLDVSGRADQTGIGAMSCLPSLKAEHRHRRSSGHII